MTSARRIWGWAQARRPNAEGACEGAGELYAEALDATMGPEPKQGMRRPIRSAHAAEASQPRHHEAGTWLRVATNMAVSRSTAILLRTRACARCAAAATAS